MISDSLDHAFDDMAERIWTETKLKAEEMLRAVAVALERVRNAIDPAEKERILEAATKLQEALQTKDTKQLQAANAVLDSATQGLAAVILAKAIESAPIKESPKAT